MQYFIIILAFIGLMSVGNFATELREDVMSKQPEGYSDVKAIIDHEANNCRTDSNFFDFNVTLRYIENSEDIDFAGRWDYNQKLMLLNQETGVDISTVAHEVAHMVQGVMEEYRVEDPHYGPYLQGVFTECVWMLVEQDLIEAGVVKVFRFAQ